MRCSDTKEPTIYDIQFHCAGILVEISCWDIAVNVKYIEKYLRAMTLINYAVSNASCVTRIVSLRKVLSDFK